MSEQVIVKKAFQVNKICEKCGLHQYSAYPKIQGRGVLSKATDLVLIGEAPGLTESKKNKVFCGRAGSKLEELLTPLKKLNAKIYITNAVKCYPPMSTMFPEKAFRVPKQSEMELCRTYLEEELKETNSNHVVLMPLGVTALKAVTQQTGEKISSIASELGVMRKVKIGRRTFSVLPNYHPSFILRNPHMAIHFNKVIDSYIKWCLS